MTTDDGASSATTVATNDDDAASSAPAATAERAFALLDALLASAYPAPSESWAACAQLSGLSTAWRSAARPA